jgi:hypothetical protein
MMPVNNDASVISLPRKIQKILQLKHTFLTQPWQLPRLRETGGWQLRLKFAMAAGA